MQKKVLSQKKKNFTKVFIVNKTYTKAINEAFDVCMQKYDNMFIIGEGVPDPNAIFGSTKGLKEKYGIERIRDMPLSENALTGVCVGAALNGMKPVLTHQRVDFSLLSLDQIINSAAKWHYMFGEIQNVPLVIKMTIGMGWGQGPQHSQNLQTLFAHIPGLKVAMPATPYDAKGLMISAIEDKNPVIYIDHRWLHNTFGEVPDDHYTVPLGKARVAEEGIDLTIATYSYMLLESLKAKNVLNKLGIHPEIIDLRTLTPLDYETIKKSVQKTGRMIVVDSGHKHCGYAAEIIARVCEDSDVNLKTNPARITCPDIPSPSTPALAMHYYPRYVDIARKTVEMMGKDKFEMENLILEEESKRTVPLDVPDNKFTGPF